MLLVTVLVVTTAVAVTIGLTFRWTSERARDDAASDAQFQAGLAAGSVQSSLTRISTALATAAAAPLTLAKLHSPGTCTLSSAGLNGYRGSHVDLVLPDGTVACSSLSDAGAPAGATDGDAPWIARALASATPVVGRTATDALTHRAAVTIAAPVKEDGKAVGLIAAVVPVQEIADGLANAFAGPRNLTFTVVEPSRKAIRSASDVEGEQWKPYVGSGFDTGPSGTWTALDGRQRLFASAAVPQLGWRVFSGVDTDSITAEARDAAGQQGVLAIVALLALAALAWFVSRRIVRPLQWVTESIVAARDEPMPAPVPVDGPREVAVLASEFNAMIEARLDYEAQLTDRALHDDLTRLPNRALLRDRLERAIRAITGGATLAVLFLDLDRFKLVNDSLGHPGGDALLQLVAARLETALRPQDTLARFGGDEFVVVCEDVDGPAGAVEIARRLESSLAEPFAVHGQSVDVSAKVGIALTTDPFANPDELVREADIAMYQAKDTARAWELWDDDLETRSQHRLELLQDLRRAVEQREIVVLYQPIWDVEEWRVAGVEALVRWDHPRLGRLAPGQFVPLAEDSGEIRVIGQYVLEEALRFVGTLARAGSPLTVSVNVAVSQLDDELVTRIAEQLEDAQLPPDSLCIELTESALCDALGSRADALTVLRAMGVHTAVDDFGTGYSSLSYFQHFPFDTLKIDRSFIEPLGVDDGRAAALVDAITSMARALDLRVVGEGIETAEQLAAARALGVRYVQGFLLSKPLEAGELRALVRRQHGAPAALEAALPRLNPA
jgi:diguanylate cyclase (GGDEF)-like protein